MAENELAHLISFVEGLRREGIAFTLGSVRDAIMVTIPFPDRYVEAEFFADGRVEVQSFGPPASDVVDCTADDLLQAVIEDMNAPEGSSSLDAMIVE